jgi:hypothetical protein
MSAQMLERSTSSVGAHPADSVRIIYIEVELRYRSSIHSNSENGARSPNMEYSSSIINQMQRCLGVNSTINRSICSMRLWRTR